ncbi:MAG: hypothetical protein ABIT58_10795 [Ferruginibacter sp.]
MRNIFLFLTLISFNQVANAQLKASNSCAPFTIDFIDGSVNGLYPESPLGEVQIKLPCFTELILEPSQTGCAGAFYRDKGIFFYTYRDYIEINNKFTGTMSFPLMGADRNSLFKWLGNAQTKDAAWDAYQMRHGILVVFFDGTGKINKIILSSKGVTSLRMCD